eukprot:tig00001049_g6674.t1
MYRQLRRLASAGGTELVTARTRGVSTPRRGRLPRTTAAIGIDRRAGWLLPKQSGIWRAGTGLFVERPGVRRGAVVFRPGDLITPYRGTIYTKTQALEIFAREPSRRLYSISFKGKYGHTYVLDATDFPEASLARFANDADKPGTHPRFSNNAFFRVEKDGQLYWSVLAR